MKIFYFTNLSIASKLPHINGSTILVPKLYDLSVGGVDDWPELSVIHCLEDVRWLTNLRSLSITINIFPTNFRLENSFDFGF